MSEMHCPRCGAQGLLRLSIDEHFACIECLHIHHIEVVGRAGRLLDQQPFLEFIDPRKGMAMFVDANGSAIDKGVTL